MVELGWGESLIREKRYLPPAPRVGTLSPVSDCLLLNSDYAPLRVIPWERAVVLLLTERAMTLAGYPGRQIRSPSIAIPWPAVVRLMDYASARPRTRFSRASVL